MKKRRFRKEDLIFVIGIFVIFFLQCCKTKKQEDNNIAEKSLQKVLQIKVQKKFNLQKDSIGVLVNEKYINIEKDPSIDCNKAYDGIYIVKNDSISKQFSKLDRNFLYFVTYEDLGMGYRTYLFTYDKEAKKLIKDPFRKTKNIYSSAAVFFLKNDRIIAVDRPIWNYKSGEWHTKAGVYKIKDGNFVFLKEIDQPGEKLMDSTLTIRHFYEKIVNHY